MESLDTLSNEDLIELYKKLKYEVSEYDILQNAKKIDLNSAFGVLGTPYFRFYDIRMAEAITLSGQTTITWIHHKVNTFLNTLLNTENIDYIIAGDTDSMFINFEKLVNLNFKDEKGNLNQIIDFLDNFSETKMVPLLKQSFTELYDYLNGFENTIEMSREIIGNRGFWTAKKNYAINVYDKKGIRYKEPELKMMGIKAIKTDIPAICREKIKESIKIIMRGEESELQDYIHKFKKEFKKIHYTDIGLPKAANDIDKWVHPITKYKKGTPIHVKGCILYNYAIKKAGLDKKYPTIKSGEKIKFIYLEMPNPLNDKVISIQDTIPKELQLNNHIDYDMMFEKTFLEPLSIILDVINWSSQKNNSLFDLFAE